MISFDTNLLLYAFDADSPYNAQAHAFLSAHVGDGRVAVAELVLVELYLLLRNPAVVAMPLTAKEAAEHCRAYRLHPRWRLVENAPVMEAVWQQASAPHFARRRIFDLRLALTLQHHGVTEFATMNVRDFEELGFRRVWNPVEV